MSSATLMNDTDHWLELFGEGQPLIEDFVRQIENNHLQSQYGIQCEGGPPEQQEIDGTPDFSTDLWAPSETLRRSTYPGGTIVSQPLVDTRMTPMPHILPPIFQLSNSQQTTGEILNARGVPAWSTFLPLDDEIPHPPPQHLAILIQSNYDIQLNGPNLIRLEDDRFGCAVWLGANFWHIAVARMRTHPAQRLVLHPAAIVATVRKSVDRAAMQEHEERVRALAEIRAQMGDVQKPNSK